MDLTLDPTHTAIVLIDLQRGIVSRQPAPYPAATVVQNGLVLSDALRSKGGMVVFVQVLLDEVLRLPVDSPASRPTSMPPDASELVPEIRLQPGDIVVAKRQWGAFYATDLEQQLRRRRIEAIILGGIATNFGVESTARAAFDRGYQIVFAEDAMTSVSVEAHNFTIANIFPRMGRVRTTQQILGALP